MADPPARFFMSTSAFLQQMLAKRRPIPLMEVRAYMIFSLPSTLVFSRRRMCWNSMPTSREPILATKGRKEIDQLPTPMIVETNTTRSAAALRCWNEATKFAAASPRKHAVRSAQEISRGTAPRHPIPLHFATDPKA